MYIHAHTQWYMYIHSGTCTYMHIHSGTCTYMHIHSGTCTYMHNTMVHVHTGTYVHSGTCTYMHIHSGTCTYMHIHSGTRTYTAELKIQLSLWPANISDNRDWPSIQFDSILDWFFRVAILEICTLTCQRAAAISSSVQALWRVLVGVWAKTRRKSLGTRLIARRHDPCKPDV